MNSISAQRDALEMMAEARELISPLHRATVAALPEETSHIVGYHIGWWDANGRPCDQTGKYIRPALAVACARAVGGEAAVKSALPAAVVVELVHDFSLLHDDVMDKGTVRRHRQTAWSLFGTSKAVLAGDLLVAEAYRLLASSGYDDPGRLVKILAQAVHGLCVGQAMDLAFEDRVEVTLAETKAMVSGKTSALIAAACELGALTAGADAEAAAVMRAFGGHLGMLFQLVDDILGVWGDPRVTGKPVGADVASRKKSLPVVAALEAGTDASRSLAALYRSADPLTSADVAKATQWVEEAGGRAWAEAEATRLRQAAQDCLEQVGADAWAFNDLLSLMRFLVERNA
ncbi:polyprenyl synthetase family protein [Streptomyces sp. WMMC940]|uniref:polyprenyl synthetase family protein n=1 Tax=Streptomyces sp. WMMC940 TaxID=3015153 RepID=UPI0022B6B8BE|nr:polyprenyl synthetase family protein [Streptomyces sp. WMMC940]MCZ7457508.1 polyprenyl synthetase family protein [Streptomyces sp. WMMC940]